MPKAKKRTAATAPSRATRESAASKRKRLDEENLEKARNIEIEAKMRKGRKRRQTAEV
jgi:hypothetical protein